MKIGVDFDGVVIDSERLAADIFAKRSEEMGRKLVRPNEWGNLRWDWTFAEWARWLQEYEDVITFDSNAMEGVKEAIDILREAGFRLYLITARQEIHTDSDTGQQFFVPEVQSAHERLKQLGITFDDYFFGIHDKAKFCSENGINIMIDDKPKQCENLSNAGVFALKFLCKHNIVMPENENLKNVKSWQEILERIEEFEARFDIRDRKLNLPKINPKRG